MKSSLTSVSFLDKPVEEIVMLAKQAELDAIEWAGKGIHVPAGDIEAARKVKKLCRENGIEISGYGSYFYAREDEDFEPVLACAREMEAKIIRVWAGKGYGPSENFPEDARKGFTERLQQAALAAKAYGITVATEFHSHCLMDTMDSVQRLLAEAPDLYTYWQMRTHPHQTTEEDLADIQALGKRIVNVHALWHRDGEKETLEDGREVMTRYLQAAQTYTNAGYAAIEFVKNGTVEQFFEDAKVLKEMLKA